MTLKEKMEAVWRRKGCACPSHLCQWNDKGYGWKYGVPYILGYVYYLWVMPGHQTFKRYFYKTPYEHRVERRRKKDYGWSMIPWKRRL